jgi:hypothetical protein
MLLLNSGVLERKMIDADWDRVTLGCPRFRRNGWPSDFCRGFKSHSLRHTRLKLKDNFKFCGLNPRIDFPPGRVSLPRRELLSMNGGLRVYLPRLRIYCQCDEHDLFHRLCRRAGRH